MTQSNPFLDILKKQTKVADPRKPILELIGQFCKGIEQYSSRKLECNLVLGYPTNYGQEYRVVIKSKRTGYEHTLLRLYIPTSGSNMKVDFYDYQLVDCATQSDLDSQLQLFLAKPETQDAINAYAQS